MNDDLPRLGAPATRALDAADCQRLSQVAELSESELMALHGMGPKAVRILREALAAKGLSLRGDEPT